MKVLSLLLPFALLYLLHQRWWHNWFLPFTGPSGSFCCWLVEVVIGWKLKKKSGFVFPKTFSTGQAVCSRLRLPVVPGASGHCLANHHERCTLASVFTLDYPTFYLRTGSGKGLALLCLIKNRAFLFFLWQLRALKIIYEAEFLLTLILFGGEVLINESKLA